jgi:hypothetical protein
LLGDLSSIIDAMKSLSCDREKNIEQLKQAHYDEIEQMKQTMENMESNYQHALGNSGGYQQTSSEDHHEIQQLKRTHADEKGQMRAEYNRIISVRESKYVVSPVAL